MTNGLHFITSLSVLVVLRCVGVRVCVRACARDVITNICVYNKVTPRASIKAAVTWERNTPRNAALVLDISQH